MVVVIGKRELQCPVFFFTVYGGDILQISSGYVECQVFVASVTSYICQNSGCRALSGLEQMEQSVMCTCFEIEPFHLKQ